MFANSLRPHRHPSSDLHTRHHEWLTHFTPQERWRLILEDRNARLHMMTILVGIVLFRRSDSGGG